MKLITPVELAEITAIEVKTLVRLAQAGKVPAMKVGGQWRFDKDRIEHWLMTTASNERQRILVVDDDPEICRVFKSMIEREMGHAVTIAEGGERAIELLKEEDRFGLIILDLKMEPISGVDVLRWMLEKEMRIAVLMLTGFPDSQMMDEALSFDVLSIVKKPVTNETLKHAVSLVLQGSGYYLQ